MTKTVIQHVLSRLRDVGVNHVFGVPGDYAFAVDDTICNDANVGWAGCCNELNVSYAADGYARIKGVDALCTAYSVGELSGLARKFAHVAVPDTLDPLRNAGTRSTRRGRLRLVQTGSAGGVGRCARSHAKAKARSRGRLLLDGGDANSGVVLRGIGPWRRRISVDRRLAIRMRRMRPRRAWLRAVANVVSRGTVGPVACLR